MIKNTCLRSLLPKRLLTSNLLLTRILLVIWDASPRSLIGFTIGATLEISGMVLSIYATAQLGGLLAAYATTRIPTSEIWYWLFADIFAASAIATGFWMMNKTKRILYYRMVQWATHSFQSALCRYDIADFENSEVRSEINKVASGYTWQISQLSQHLLDFIYSIVRLGILSLLVAQIAWWLIPLLSVFLIPSLITEHKIQKIQWFVWDEKGNNRHIFWGIEYLLRRVRAQMEIRSMQATQYLLNKLKRMNIVFYSKQEKYFIKINRYVLPAKLFEVAGTAIGAIYLLGRFLQSEISLSSYFFLSGSLLRINGALNASIGSLTYLQEPLIFARSYFSVIDRKPQIINPPNPTKIRGSLPPKIEFIDVGFKYPRKAIPVFSGLSFTINPGEHVAFVGENGAGKSTIIKLLLRFYVPTEGRILIDGIDIQQLDIETWFERVATLFQDFNQYPLTARENITIGNPNTKYKSKLFEDAITDSRTRDIINNYPSGVDTFLDSSFDNGIEPSGGQWQRIALARVFYRQASVLILDEPTSAIDANAEYEIFNSIFERYKKRTAIIVSHRFSTVRRADRIIVLHEGKIIEQGSHGTLMKKENLYSRLFQKQAKGYRDE